MAKVFYSGYGDWTIGDKAFITHPTRQNEWLDVEYWPIGPKRDTYPLATEKDIHILIFNIFDSLSIEVK